MGIIDQKGYIHIFKWKLNAIDALVILLLLSICGLAPIAYKVMTTKIVLPPETTYLIVRSCPICGQSMEIWTKKGKPLPEVYENICPRCENRVALIGEKKIEPKSSTFYTVPVRCPNCYNTIKIKIDKGESLPKDYKTTCKECENKVALFKSQPKPTIPSLPGVDYEQEYYKRKLENRVP